MTEMSGRLNTPKLASAYRSLMLAFTANTAQAMPLYNMVDFD